MGQYRIRDVLQVPGLLSLARIPLAAAFPRAAKRPAVALAVLACAALTDVLDGWVARRFDRVTATGAVLDAVTDKIFVSTVALTLVARRQLGLRSVALLSVRDLGELPLVLWLALGPGTRRRRVEPPAANYAGKLATTLQFASVAVVLCHGPLGRVLIVAAAMVGGAAAVTYWSRELGAARPVSPFGRGDALAS